MSEKNATKRKSFWSWPGPLGSYDNGIVMVLGLLLWWHFGKSQFVMTVTCALLLCIGISRSEDDIDLSKSGEGGIRRFKLWIIRGLAALLGYWMFSSAPTMTSGWVAVILYFALYFASERFMLRRQRCRDEANSRLDEIQKKGGLNDVNSVL
jgi:hypothetical protein